MKFNVEHQKEYSRGELVMRTFFGSIYIVLPLAFISTFMYSAMVFIPMLSFWYILFTGQYPKSYFEIQKTMFKWYLRYASTLLHLVDGFPLPDDGKVTFEIEKPESSSRGLLLLRVF